MTLALPSQKAIGRLVTGADGKRPVLVLQPPEMAGGETFFLRFALVLLGTERPILPSFVLDDWGREKRKLSFYRWIYREGDRFPRSEIFGYYLNRENRWEEGQFFVRDLELSARWPVFVAPADDAPPSAGVRLHGMGREEAGVSAPEKVEMPADIPFPLQRGAVSWWRLPPGIQTSSFI